MASFSDDFNRPDGPVGNGWTTTGYLTRILAGKVVTYAQGSIWRAMGTPGGYQLAEATVPNPAVNTTSGSAAVKMTGTGLGAYSAYVSRSAAGLRLYLQGRADGPVYFAVPSGAFQSSDPSLVVRVSWDNGMVYGECVGYASLSHSDSNLAANTRVGGFVTLQTSVLDAWYGTDQSPRSFVETVDPIVQAAQESGVEFVGTGTAWTPGAPGSPIFTVDKGTLSGQEIQSPTQATANYLPPQADDVATFTDPSTGLTDQVALSTGFQVQSGEACKLTDAGAAVVNLAGLLHPNGEVLTSDFVVDMGLNLDLHTFLADLNLKTWLLTGRSETYQEGEAGLLYKLWRILNGQEAPYEGLNILDELVEVYNKAANIHQDLDNTTEAGALTLRTLLGDWGGNDPSIYKIIETLAAIQTLDGLNLQDVINQIQALYGPGPGTLGDILIQLAQIRGGPNLALPDLQNHLTLLTSNGLYGLNDVATWIQNIQVPPAPELAQIIAKLESIQGSGAANLTDMDGTLQYVKDYLDNMVLPDQAAIIAAITVLGLALSAEHAAISTAIAGLVASEGANWLTNVATLAGIVADVAEIITAINEIKALSARKTPPVYPGPAGVNMLDPIPFEADGDFTVACDGALLAISEVGDSPWRVTSMNVTRYSRLGVFAFRDSAGYKEPIQPVQFTQQVLTPKNLLTCGGIVIQCKPGTIGTLHPWTLKA